MLVLAPEAHVVTTAWARVHLTLEREVLTGHLSVAIPYCDVVVCDKKMSDVVRRSGLDKRYGTTVFANLEKAVEYLESLPTIELR